MQKNKENIIKKARITENTKKGTQESIEKNTLKKQKQRSIDKIVIMD